MSTLDNNQTAHLFEGDNPSSRLKETMNSKKLIASSIIWISVIISSVIIVKYVKVPRFPTMSSRYSSSCGCNSINTTGPSYSALLGIASENNNLSSALSYNSSSKISLSGLRDAISSDLSSHNNETASVIGGLLGELKRMSSSLDKSSGDCSIISGLYNTTLDKAALAHNTTYTVCSKSLSILSPEDKLSSLTSAISILSSLQSQVIDYGPISLLDEFAFPDKVTIALDPSSKIPYYIRGIKGVLEGARGAMLELIGSSKCIDMVFTTYCLSLCDLYPGTCRNVISYIDYGYSKLDNLLSLTTSGFDLNATTALPSLHDESLRVNNNIKGYKSAIAALSNITKVDYTEILYGLIQLKISIQNATGLTDSPTPSPIPPTTAPSRFPTSSIPTSKPTTSVLTSFPCLDGNKSSLVSNWGLAGVVNPTGPLVVYTCPPLRSGQPTYRIGLGFIGGSYTLNPFTMIGGVPVYTFHTPFFEPSPPPSCNTMYQLSYASLESGSPFLLNYICSTNGGTAFSYSVAPPAAPVSRKLLSQSCSVIGLCELNPELCSNLPLPRCTSSSSSPIFNSSISANFSSSIEILNELLGSKITLTRMNSSAVEGLSSIDLPHFSILLPVIPGIAELSVLLEGLNFDSFILSIPFIVGPLYHGLLSFLKFNFSKSGLGNSSRYHSMSLNDTVFVLIRPIPYMLILYLIILLIDLLSQASSCYDYEALSSDIAKCSKCSGSLIVTECHYSLDFDLRSLSPILGLVAYYNMIMMITRVSHVLYLSYEIAEDIDYKGESSIVNENLFLIIREEGKYTSLLFLSIKIIGYLTLTIISMISFLAYDAVAQLLTPFIVTYLVMVD